MYVGRVVVWAPINAFYQIGHCHIGIQMTACNYSDICSLTQLQQLTTLAVVMIFAKIAELEDKSIQTNKVIAISSCSSSYALSQANLKL